RASGPDGDSQTVAVTIAAGAKAAPIHLAMTERPVVRGRIELGDRKANSIMIGVRAENVTRITSSESDRTFCLGDVEARRYQLVLTLDGRPLTPDPSTVDLTNGPVRDLVVRVAPDQPR